MDKTEFINDLAKIEAQNESNLQNNDIVGKKLFS
jgi:hypothetical protein